MATEQLGYPAFRTFPVTGPAVSPPRPIDATTGGCRVTLSGTTFSVRVQISNAQATTTAAHLFLPAETDWETYATLTAPDAPASISPPVRWVRLILDSGTLTGGHIEESTRVTPMVDDRAVREFVSDRVDTALPNVVDARLPIAVQGAMGAFSLSRAGVPTYAGGAATVIVDGRVYQRDDTAAPDGGRVLQAAGARYVIADQVTRPEQYGALGRIYETPCTVQSGIRTYAVPAGHPLKAGHGVMLLSSGQIHRSTVEAVTATAVTMTTAPGWSGAGVLSSDDADPINAALGASRNVMLDGNYAVGTPINLCTRTGRRLFGRGYGTEIRGATGRAVIEAVESSYGVVGGIRLTSHPQRPSVGGILFARRQDTYITYCMYFQLAEVYIEMPRLHTANGGFGTYGIYNFAGEIHTYSHVHVDADMPFVGTDENFAGITALNATVLQTKESMSVVKFTGACTLGASKGEPMTLSGMFDLEFTAGYMTGYNSVFPQFAAQNEADAYGTTDSQRTTKQAIRLRGVTNENIHISGHVENCTRVALIESDVKGLHLDISILRTQGLDLITINNTDFDVYMNDWNVRIRNQDTTASNMLKWTNPARGSGGNLNFVMQRNQTFSSSRPFSGRIEGLDLHRVQLHPASGVYVSDEYGAHTRGQAAFRVYASGGTQDLPNGTWQTMFFSGETYDDLSEVTTDPTGTNFTPRTSGTYVFTVRTLVLNVTVGNLAQQRITVNGVPVVNLDRDVVPTGVAQVLQGSAELRLNAGDVVRVQTNSQAYNVAADGETETYWTGRRV